MSQVSELRKAVGEIADAVDVLARRVLKAGPPRSGLVPQSGDPQHPDRWVRADVDAGDLRGIGMEGDLTTLRNNDAEYLHAHRNLLSSGISRALPTAQAIRAFQRTLTGTSHRYNDAGKDKFTGAH